MRENIVIASLTSAFSLALLLLAPASGQILTAQYDNARTGATLHETTLTPANVNAAHFGKIFSFAMRGRHRLFQPTGPGNGIVWLIDRRRAREEFLGRQAGQVNNTLLTICVGFEQSMTNMDQNYSMSTVRAKCMRLNSLDPAPGIVERPIKARCQG